MRKRVRMRRNDLARIGFRVLSAGKRKLINWELLLMLNSHSQLSFPDVVNYFIKKKKKSKQPSAKMSLPPEKVSELKQIINNHIVKVSKNANFSSSIAWSKYWYIPFHDA